jgi:CO/xanthine dehydrogenase Mo-binding subunit
MADLSINGDRKEFKVVGKPNLPGKLSWAVATGVAKFGSDYVVPGMLEAKFMRSPYAHARIKSYNKAKAMAVPGVVDIVTWKMRTLKILNAAEEWVVRHSLSLQMLPMKKILRWDL